MIVQHGRLAGYRAALEDVGCIPDDRLIVNVLNNGPALAAVSDLFDWEGRTGSSASTTRAPGTCTSARRGAG